MKVKFFGTEVYISFLFCAVLCFMLCIDRTGLVIPTLFAVFIHESGHMLAMWATDCQPKAIRLIPTSVQIVRGFSPKKCGDSRQSLVFATLNLVIAVFNLMPVSGLDGGTLLTLLLSRFTDIYKAERTVRIITAVFAFSVFLLGVYFWASGTLNISVFITAIYLAVCCLIKK